MALGAPPGVVAGRVVRSGLLLAGLGIPLGSVAAAVSTRFLESLLFEVSALAPSAFLAPALALAAAGRGAPGGVTPFQCHGRVSQFDSNTMSYIVCAA